MIDGPTPLEIARSPIRWYTDSEKFYLTGKILFENMIMAKESYYSDFAGKGINLKSKRANKFKEIRLIMTSKTPLVFNLSFSIELLVKAILVKIDPEKWIPEKGNVKFGHNVYILIDKEIPITLNNHETVIAKRLGEYISYGKYPERNRPGEVIEKYEDLFNFHPYNNWDLSEFFEIITSLRVKLRDYFLTLVKK